MPEPREVARYTRRIGAGIERVWENVRDWEHLPWLHRASFRAIALEDEGERGWRARLGLANGSEIRLELAIEGARYVSRTLEGDGAGSEIWTSLREIDDAHTDIEVAFLVPGVSADAAVKLGPAYVQLYTRLWDEDESMMVGRQLYLDRAFTEARCPHRGGPLRPCASDPALLECPWHGYRYDAATGACLDDPRLRVALRS